MTDAQAQLRDLVVANRILAHEGVVDMLGHVSIRHPERPDRFFLSQMRSPELVTFGDLLEFDLLANPLDQRERPIYNERYIHGAIYEARPDIVAVVHNHAPEVIPFSIAKTVKLRPVMHIAATIGFEVPVWDIRDKFGDRTDLLVKTVEQGRDLARSLGSKGKTALMRGHGCVVGGGSLYEAVRTAINMKLNARLQAEAMRFGEIVYLSEGEVETSAEMVKVPKNFRRAWDYWSRRCGADKLFD